MATTGKRGNPEHDTPPKDLRYKRNKTGGSDELTPTHCWYAQTSLLNVVQIRVLMGMTPCFVKVSVKHGCIECVLIGLTNRPMKYLLKIILLTYVHIVILMSNEG